MAVAIRQVHAAKFHRGISIETLVYTGLMGKHLVDIDEEALASAQAELKTTTMKETVNEALRLACVQRTDRVAASLDRLAKRDLPPREDAWR